MTNKLSFNFRNFGYLKKGKIELSDLTIICGKNNVGKTYLNYGIYGFLNSIKNNLKFSFDKELDELLMNGFINLDLKKFEYKIKEILKQGVSTYSQNLPMIFATDEDFFKKTLIQFNIDKLKFNYISKKEYKAEAGDKIVTKFVKPENTSIAEINLLETKVPKIPKKILQNILNHFIGETILNPILPKPHVITSERTGVVLFNKELDFTKNRMLDYISKNKKKQFNPFDFLEEFKAQYPISVQQNIDWVRNLYNTKKTKSYLWKDDKIRLSLNKILRQIIRGDFKITKDELFYVFTENRIKSLIPIHTASSSVKSLVLLDSYIKNIAKKGDLLIIDEPELNLHPDLQVLMARLIAKLSNLGIKILITTHSDYMIKEFNNLIMLHSASKKDSNILDSLKYHKDEILDNKKVKVYLNKNNTINPVDIDEFGINFKDLDDFILVQNKKTNRLFNILEE